MKRIIKVLVVSALMMVLMATTVSPAFAVPKSSDDKWGYGDGTAQGWGVKGTNGGCDEGPKKAQGWGTSDGQGGWSGCEYVNYNH